MFFAPKVDLWDTLIEQMLVQKRAQMKLWKHVNMHWLVQKQLLTAIAATMNMPTFLWKQHA